MKVFFVFFIALFFCSSVNADDYAVLVAAYGERVSLSTFKSLDGKVKADNSNGIVKYYLYGFTDADVAENAAARAREAGFPHARVENLSAKRMNCAKACTTEDPSLLQSIFFDYAQSRLRTQSRSQLERLASLLEVQPSYTVMLRGHTDNHGTDDYNTALSNSRADKSKAYLVSLGVIGERISTMVFGETAPIADNDIAGKDSPAGRQLNRRVEIIVIDSTSGEEINVVEEIYVPDHLRL
ncbi:OmpA family protein [Chitinophagales bacterium]|nr:OmpA family protein [Chitinophagales bacterium]